MKLTLSARIYDSAYMAICGIFIGPAIGGFLFGAGFMIFSLAVFAGGLIFAPIAALHELPGSDLSEAGSVLMLPFVFALAAYLPGVPIAATTALLAGARIVSCGKISRQFIWLSSFASPVLIILCVPVFDGKHMDSQILMMGAVLCALSVISADLVYRAFGRHLSVANDLVVVDEKAMFDSVKKEGA